MKFYSTNKKAQIVDIKQAVLQGLAEDNGLYMPESIPRLSQSVISDCHGMSFREIAFEIANAFLQDDIPRKDLQEIVYEAVNFDAPLISLTSSIYCLELFHGPTLAFKDFGARFMAGLISYFLREGKRKLTVLVATSGDTGSAVAHGFLGKPNIDVVILYPSGKVSHVQEKQLTTLGENITTLEVRGTFDDCQKMVKEAFLDEEVAGKMFLTSANSINIARLIPQSFYYAYAYSRLPKTDGPIIFSVPSGNFGNITAGILAKHMGFPITKFVAATNINDVVPEYLSSGLFNPRASLQTISNAMDVGNPSNFARLNDIFNSSLADFQKEISGFSCSDEETLNAIKEVSTNYNYVCDPHGAVAFLGLKDYFRKNAAEGTRGVFLETAHPAKFLDVVDQVLPSAVTIPDRLKECIELEKKSILMDANYSELKEFLVGR